MLVASLPFPAFHLQEIEVKTWHHIYIAIEKILNAIQCYVNCKLLILLCFFLWKKWGMFLLWQKCTNLRDWIAISRFNA